MSWALVIWVGSALIALAFGIWLGMPGRYTQRHEDIERVMDQGGGRRRSLQQRSINPLAWMQRHLKARGSRNRGSGRGRGGFKLESPDDR